MSITNGSAIILNSRLTGGNIMIESTASSMATSSVTVQNSNFMGSSTTMLSAFSWSIGSVNLVNNTFYFSQITCSGGSFSGSGNSFCGSNSLQGGCPNISSIQPIFYSPYDSCGICNGNNQNKNCNGCFVSGTNCLAPKGKNNYFIYFES